MRVTSPTTHTHGKGRGKGTLLVEEGEHSHTTASPRSEDFLLVYYPTVGPTITSGHPVGLFSCSGIGVTATDKPGDLGLNTSVRSETLGSLHTSGKV